MNIQFKTSDEMIKYLSDNQLFICKLNDDFIPTDNELESIIGYTKLYSAYLIGDTVYLYRKK